MHRRFAKHRVSIAPQESLIAPQWLQPFWVAVVASLLLALFTGEIRDTDIWLHLKTGQHTLQTGSLAVPDPFSYTSGTASVYAGEEVTRRFNLTHEWLTQVLMYLTYAVAGFPGLVLARALLLVGFCAIAGGLAFRRCGNFYLSLAAALAAAGMAWHFQQSRPFLITFVCLALTIATLETRRRMWLLPALFLFWANCHGGFIMGWLALAAYCGEAGFYRLRKKPVSNERSLWLTAAACLLISGLNPNGFRIIQVLFHYSISPIQTNNLEWQRPIFWEPGIYSFLLFGTLLALLAARRRSRPVDWLLYFGFAAVSLTAVRNTVFMGLVGPVLMAAYLPMRRGVPATALVAASLAVVVFAGAPAMASGNMFAFRVAEWQLPSGAADFIETHKLTHRMFNGYEHGGYLVWRLWPLQRVFMDPRGLSEEAYRDYMHILMNTDGTGGRGTQTLLAKYGIEMIVVEGFDYLSGQPYPLAVELGATKGSGWKLAHADSTSLLFMKRPPPGVEPGDSTATLLASLAAQCEQHVLHDPLPPLCARGLAELHAFLGRPDEAKRWVSYYLDHKTGPDPAAEQMRQSLEVTSLNASALEVQSKGDVARAEQLLVQALAVARKTLGPDHPDTAGLLNNLGGLLESKGDVTRAEEAYRRALGICENGLGADDPRTATSLDNLAGLLAARGDAASAKPLYRRALAIAQKAFGPDHPTTQAIRESLAGLANNPH